MSPFFHSIVGVGMVFHARKSHASKKKIDLAKLAPYALHLAMVVAVGVYVIVGAYAIRQIEATPKKIEMDVATSRLRRDTHEIRRFSMNRTRKCVIAAVEKIGRLTNCTKIPDGSYLEILDDCYEHDLRRIAEMAKHRKEQALHPKQKSANSTQMIDSDEMEYWTMMDSVLFCFTVITTIGYGNVAPRSFHGRLFVILYGLVGVPFTMLAIANLGKFLATVLKTWTRPFVMCFRRFRRRCCRKQHTAKEKQRLMDKESKKPAKGIDDDSSDGEAEAAEADEEDDGSSDGVVLFLSFVIYIVVGSMVIAAYEPQMDFFEAIYFNFVTLTTIGLGDLVPQSDKYLVITLLYCAVGLALTTIAIEIAADTLKKLHYFGRKVDNVAAVQVWFGGKKISMKALVKNLGDQFNVPLDELANLNIDKFVDDAIKVEQGELSTLRQDKDWMNSNYWRAIESGSMHYVDDDDLVTLRSNPSLEFLLAHVPSREMSPLVEVAGHAPFRPESLHSPQMGEETTQEGMYQMAIWMEPPTLLRLDRPCPVPTDSTNALFRSYRRYQREKEMLDGKWSADAMKRYEEYQATWKKYRTTGKKDEP